MLSLARMQTVVALAFATLVSAASASLDGLPRKLLQTTTATYDGFFDRSRPSECGFTCRVIVISVGGGLVLLTFFILICCCCCCCRRKKKSFVAEPIQSVPYNYQATPAVTTAPQAAPAIATIAPATAYGGLTTGKGGRVGPPSNASSYTAPTDNFSRAGSGSSTASGIGRNTLPGTYNPRKF